MTLIGKLRILFLCTGNSCRSQMAEGLCNSLKSHEIECYSAGIETHGLNPLAVKVMAESGIDISGNQSTTVEQLGDIEFDYVVTVCSNAHETCPVFKGRANIVHHGFDDPPRLAAMAQNEAEALPHYRRVRDEIKQFIVQLPGAVTGNTNAT